MMNPNLNHTLEVRFKKAVGADEFSFDFHLRLTLKFIEEVSKFDALLKASEWLIATGERDSSYLYPVFDANGPTTAALAVLKEEGKGNDAVKGYTLWNGQEVQGKGASVTCRFGRRDGVASSFKLSIRSPREQMRLGGWSHVSDTLCSAARIFSPIYGSIETTYYEGVFKDRPGVGWMLYLPQVLTVQQVPEARALVPLMSDDDGKKSKPVQIGTIVVSVTDEPFTEDNPEHVKTAHAIEIRLVDQDLLPRYAEIWQ